MDSLIIKSYIRERGKGAGVFGLAVLLLFGVAGLYDYGQAIANMTYALFLILFFGACLGVRDFVGYYGRCKRLMEAVRSCGEWQESFPEARTLEERLYQQLVEGQQQEKRRLVTEYDEKKRDMADYYTMWTHQIKTPIAAIRLLLEEEEGPGPVQANERDQAAAKMQLVEKGRKQNLEEELFKTEQYAEMALCYARLESLSSDLLFKEQDARKIVGQALRKYKILFIGSGLSFSIEDFSCPVVTDEKWLCMVMEQILSNALKYTREGKISVYGADADGERREGRVSYLVIEDTGIGIRSEDLPRIFERGFTGYNGRMDKKSTGIGLYLCRQIMDRLSHTIRVESREGVGTRVILGFEQEIYGHM